MYKHPCDLCICQCIYIAYVCILACDLWMDHRINGDRCNDEWNFFFNSKKYDRTRWKHRMKNAEKKWSTRTSHINTNILHDNFIFHYAHISEWQSSFAKNDKYCEIHCTGYLDRWHSKRKMREKCNINDGLWSLNKKKLLRFLLKKKIAYHYSL